jgi:hypothetical protein
MSDAAVHAYATQRQFSAATLSRWLAEPAADRDALLALATRLRLGENQFRDVYDAAADVAARDGSSIAAVLEAAPVHAAWAGSAGRNEAIRALKLALRRLRYPQLSAAEHRLAALAKQLALPAGVRIEFPPDLEGEEVTVTVRARSAAELRARSEALAAASRAAAVDDMFALLEGAW